MDQELITIPYKQHERRRTHLEHNYIQDLLLIINSLILSQFASFSTIKPILFGTHLRNLVFWSTNFKCLSICGVVMECKFAQLLLLDPLVTCYIDPRAYRIIWRAHFQISIIQLLKLLIRVLYAIDASQNSQVLIQQNSREQLHSLENKIHNVRIILVRMKAKSDAHMRVTYVSFQELQYHIFFEAIL